MEISSVSNSTAQALQALKRNEDAQNPAVTKKEREAEAPPTPKADPRPVINAQGQTTGQILNVSA